MSGWPPAAATPTLTTASARQGDVTQDGDEFLDLWYSEETRANLEKIKIY